MHRYLGQLNTDLEMAYGRTGATLASVCPTSTEGYEQPCFNSLVLVFHCEYNKNLMGSSNKNLSTYSSGSQKHEMGLTG